MITLFDLVVAAKKHGVIDDSTDKPLDFGTVLGFCTLNNGVNGILLNGKNYTINEGYFDTSGFVHYSTWYVSGIVSKEKMHTLKGILSFNETIPSKHRKIKAVMLLDGTHIII